MIASLTFLTPVHRKLIQAFISAFPWTPARRSGYGHAAGYVVRAELTRRVLAGVWIMASCLAGSACGESTQNAEDAAPTGSMISSEPVNLDSPMGILSLLGIGQSELAQFQQGAHFSEDQTQVLHRLLRVIPQIPRQRLARWQRLNCDWNHELNEPERLQHQVFRVSGTLTGLSRESLPDVISQRLGFKEFYRATLSAPDAMLEYDVFLRRIPDAFAKSLDAGVPVRENVALTGLFLKSSNPPAPSDARTLRRKVFLVADLLEWFPADPDSPRVKDHPDYLKLAEYGMDVGALDTVKDQKPLLRDDREAFYQLLATVGKQPAMDLRARSKAADVVELLQNPAQHRGAFYSVDGTARRAIRIEVEDPDVVERFGITHYYEIEVFDYSANVKVRDKRFAGREAVYHSYPIVFCTRTLPEGFPTGDVIRENVQINGVYLKLWAYRTQFIHNRIADDDGPPPMQISPLLIGHAPLYLLPPKNDVRVGALAAISFFVVIAGTWGLVIWFNKGNARFRRETIAPRVDLEWVVDPESSEDMHQALQQIKTTVQRRTIARSPNTTPQDASDDP